jgi:leucyl aminopeptidase
MFAERGMEISFDRLRSFGEGALVVGVMDGGKLTDSASAMDQATGGAVSRALAASRFRGQAGHSLELLVPSGIKPTRLILAGLGKGEDFTTASAERLAASVVGRLHVGGEEALTFAIERPKKARLSEAELAAHLAFGAVLRSYRFDQYRSLREDERPTLKRVVISTSETSDARKLWGELSAIADGIFLARDLVNEPANVLHPEEFARRTLELKKLGVSVEIFDVQALQKLDMNALLGVGQGSAHESRMVVMHWDGRRGNKTKSDGAPLAFVGKGVCFDSGGLSLKPANSMTGMKGDMGGAAAVVGLMHALAARKARANVVGLVGLVENMPDGNAQRPNDIVKTMSGQTIEILNTDAEGRLVLADVLWYAQSRFKPRFMVDLATLTGAILVALGAEHAGLFSNDDDLAKKIVKSGAKEGEPVWRLPLGDAYDQLVKSKIADMKNIGGPHAGSITAAQILQRFVNKVPWAHLDIAGVAWQDGEQKPLAPSWGTGWGVRILNRLVAEYSE